MTITKDISRLLQVVSIALLIGCGSQSEEPNENVCVGEYVIDGDDTQADIDAVKNCEVITDGLEIIGTDLVNLDFLSSLKRLGGTRAPYTVVSFGRGDLTIQYNESLENLSGLENLEALHGDILVENNAALVDFVGLSRVTHFSSNIEVRSNPSLTSLKGLEGITELGSLLVSDNSSLKTLDGLQGVLKGSVDLNISQNESLESLEALSSLSEVSGDLIVQQNPLLKTIGLSRLESVDQDFGIQNNAALEAINGLSSLALIGQSLWVSMHPNMPACEAENFVSRIGEDNIGGQIILEGNLGEAGCE